MLLSVVNPSAEIREGYENHVVVTESGRILNGDVGFVADVIQRIESFTTTHAVDGLEASGRHEPRARIHGHALLRPLLDRGHEGIVQGLLSDVEIAEQADQRREDPARLGAVDRLDGIA